MALVPSRPVVCSGNPTTNPPDKVKEFSFKASGGSYAKLFDGTERPVSWDNVIWLNRTVLQ